MEMPPPNQKSKGWLKEALSSSRPGKKGKKSSQPKRWESRVSYRLPVALKQEVKELADAHTVGVGELVYLPIPACAECTMNVAIFGWKHIRKYRVIPSSKMGWYVNLLTDSENHSLLSVGRKNVCGMVDVPQTFCRRNCRPCRRRSC